MVSWLYGFDHGAGHPLLFLDDAKVPNCRKNNGFMDLGNYAEWPKVAGAVIKAHQSTTKSDGMSHSPLKVQGQERQRRCTGVAPPH